MDGPLYGQASNATVGALKELEARLGILESERGGLLDGQEALLAGLQSVEAEAEEHEERIALLEGEAERLAVLEEDMERLSTLEEKFERLGRQLVRRASGIAFGGC